jgi:glycosyltransferase involved in cell wall biosynthesis
VLSIIVPVYNAAKTIRKCVQSIVAQTVEDKEILLIDDGSTDDSYNIIVELSSLYPIVHAFHKENGGVSSARNYGINYARGAFITFIDSDDYYLDKDYLYSMYSNICNNNHIDLVVSGYTVIRENNEHVVSSLNKCIDAGEFASAYYKEYKNCGLFNSVCNKIFKKELIHSFFDSKLTMGEDAVFVLNYICNCSKISFVSSIGYGYLYFNTSTTSEYRKSIPYDAAQSSLYHEAIHNMLYTFLDRKEVAVLYLLIRTDALYYMLCSVIKKRGVFRLLLIDISQLLNNQLFLNYKSYYKDVPVDYSYLPLMKSALGKKQFLCKIMAIYFYLKYTMYRRNH